MRIVRQRSCTCLSKPHHTENKSRTMRSAECLPVSRLHAWSLRFRHGSRHGQPSVIADVAASRHFLSPPMKKTPARYTYNYQLAGYAFHYYDDKGPVDFRTFAKAFESFPWGEQMRQREKMAEGCSATISVVDHEQRFHYWVSVMGDDRRPTFLLGAVYDKRLRRSARRKKPETVQWVETRIAPSRRSVLSTYRIFFAGETDKLRRRLRAYKLYAAHERWNPATKYESSSNH